MNSAHRTFAIAVIALCLLPACGATESVVDQAAQSGTTPDVVATADQAETVSVDDEDAGSGAVPFPPPRNIVEWPELLSLGNPAEMVAAAFEHPLAAALIDTAELAEEFDGGWVPSWAVIVEGDDVADEPCAPGSTVTELDTNGIDVTFESTTGQAVAVGLRQGSRVQALLPDLQSTLTCDAASLGGTVVPAQVRVTSGTEHVAFTLDVEIDGRELYISFVAATRGDYFASAGSGADSVQGAAENLQSLAAIVDLMLERLPEP